MLAIVFVGKSKRFPNKHFVEIRPGCRLIDLVLNSLRNAGLEVLVFSKVYFDCPVPLLEDKEEWILPSFIYLFEELSKRRVKEFLAIAGDMPLISPLSVSYLLSSFSQNCLALVPRWNNGWLEPLFAGYRLGFLKYLKKAFGKGVKSLQDVIKGSSLVRFVEAESFPLGTFFNVNNPEDLFKLKEMLDKNAYL